tara:strand:+ start:53 stop:226 length:174 start_codon:yes stop_codon:yes gene_type:complete
MDPVVLSWKFLKIIFSCLKEVTKQHQILGSVVSIELDSALVSANSNNKPNEIEKNSK